MLLWRLFHIQDDPRLIRRMISKASQHELGNRRSGAPTALSPSALSVILGQQVKWKEVNMFILSSCNRLNCWGWYYTENYIVLTIELILNYNSATWEQQNERLFIVPTAKWFLIIILLLGGESRCFLLRLLLGFVPVTSSCCGMMYSKCSGSECINVWKQGTQSFETIPLMFVCRVPFHSPPSCDCFMWLPMSTKKRKKSLRTPAQALQWLDCIS